MVFLRMLQVKNISFAYGKHRILKDLSFSVEKGQNLAIIGESGSGKSTLLKLIYGQFDLTSGELWWDGKKILGPAFNLVVGYDFMKQVTQEFDLMPYTTVAENIGEFLSNFYPEEKAARTEELLEVVELEPFKDRKVKHLSGGQKQRVALARALAKSPEILLLDEPFSHIDNFKKHSLRRKVFKFLKSQGITCLVATHDKEDVLGFADEILVLHEQSIIRKGRPKDLYEKPQQQLIASFFEEYSVVNEQIYYAHQLAIVASSDHVALVKGSFYNGRNWLIQADYQNHDIFIEHHQSVAVGESICFSIKV